MTDRRLFRSNGRVAHVSLRGKISADTFVEGELYRVEAVVADLRSTPDGGRDRQLLRGEQFRALTVENGMAFGFAEKDGYVGWVDSAALVGHPDDEITHVVSAPRSYAKTSSGLKTMGHVTPLPHGAQLASLESKDGWTKLAWSRGTIPRNLFVPSNHIRPIDSLETDPITVAERFLGTPYLWGGNSSFGIDCSGLVQAALLACGISCPGDSDMQESAFPTAKLPYQRGDLLFWKGHVAMVCTPDMLIHANAHHMAVAYEAIPDAIARIAQQGDGPVTAHTHPQQESPK